MGDRQMQLEAARAAAAGCFPLGDQENAVIELRNGSTNPSVEYVYDVVCEYIGDYRRVVNACARYTVEAVLDSGRKSVSEDVLRDWDSGKIEPVVMLERLR